MRGPGEAYDMTSVGVVAIVAIVCVVLIVTGVSPLEGTPLPAAGGQAYAYTTTRVPVGEQFDVSSFDFNGDGVLDLYDYQDVLDGRIDCSAQDCDLNDDGLVDAADQESFALLVSRLYDYDNDLGLTRDDPLFLRDIMAGTAACDADHVCDLDGDGYVSSADLTLYTSLLYNADNAENLVGAAKQRFTRPIRR